MFRHVPVAGWRAWHTGLSHGRCSIEDIAAVVETDGLTGQRVSSMWSSSRRAARLPTTAP